MGHIGRDWRDSEPWWPSERRPPPGSPNVMLVVLDDVGYAQLGCYGSDIETPVLDQLAAGGVRLANFHTTSLCSPTRACLLTGRNHHRNGMGRVADLAVGFPGYWGRPPRENGFLSEILRAAGYATYAIGKWHLTPEDETNMAASRATWPLGRGFDRWYGFHGGETHQFRPALFCDNSSVRPPGSRSNQNLSLGPNPTSGRRANPGPDHRTAGTDPSPDRTGGLSREPGSGGEYHLTEDLADRAIEYIGDLRAVDADKPFFLYFAPGACHSPHQPPARWRAHYRGRFDLGWDAWRQQIYARQLSSGLLSSGLLSSGLLPSGPLPSGPPPSGPPPSGLPPTSTGLSPRPGWVPAWSDLDDRERAVAARFMECFAGFLSHADEQLGRVLDFLGEIGDADNTIVIVVSDNGASSEGGPIGSINDVRLVNLDPATNDEMFDRLDEIGGPSTHNNYPWGWTMAGNTPFRRWKREVHEGGIADPCIVSWPRGARDGLVEAGGIRHQFAHAIDVLPTLAELVGLADGLPSEIDGVVQSSIDGVSFGYLLPGDGAERPERHETQYFEMLGSRAIYHQGWKAVTFHPVGPLYDDQDPNASFDDDVWELYHVAEDLSECHDLAAERPELLAELVERWWQEARRNQVLPLDNRALWALVNPKPDHRRPREVYRYFPGGAPIPEPAAVQIRNRSHALVVDVTVAEAGQCDGVMLALGSALGGWSLHVLDGQIRYVHNLYGKERHLVTASGRLEVGDHRIEYIFEKDAGLGGTGVLRCDGVEVGRAEIPRFTPSGFNAVGVGLTCGYECGPAVGEGYEAPFPFAGLIRRAVVEVRGPVVRDPLAELEAILAQQ